MTTARHGVPPPRVDDVEEQAAPEVRVSRRRWVRGAVLGGTAVAAGVGLAACTSAESRSSGPEQGAGGGSAPASTPSGAAAATAGSTSAADPGAPPPPDPATATGGGGDTGPEQQFHTVQLGKTSSIPVGGGVVYRSKGVVVTQPTRDVFKVFSASCTHLGCLVDKIAAGQIQCPCHGARFSIVDGTVKAGPAPRALTQQGFSVQDGVIHLD